MTTVKIVLALFGAMITALILIIAAAMCAVMVAVATGTSLTVPGLISADAGKASELATVQLEPGAPAWFVGLTVVVTGVFLLWQYRADRHRRVTAVAEP